MNITIQQTESLTGIPLVLIWLGEKQVILKEDEFKNLKEEISSFNKEVATELPVKEQIEKTYKHKITNEKEIECSMKIEDYSIIKKF